MEALFSADVSGMDREIVKVDNTLQVERARVSGDEKKHTSNTAFECAVENLSSHFFFTQNRRSSFANW